ncbi:RNA polymerase sigma factor [Pedobacter xixiisoli]|uniref:RNA polymerase sigma-70 factor, ECF subfamily n=1 Tax=Pedobacter xixiisoli TaxID=1476464 RepID=A0A285ZZJ0_9SPHI|nr:RNA polymerase sigma-70 factor [Pedobacter xixiisoli]SOD15076.1 RNA polymerase sigma-70 factor, ECF subfamily [Pedobacter xixiisoli]
MTDFTDEDLLALLKNDDEKAFGLLYDRYWERMIAKSYAALGSHVDAEEIVQDTFINLWKKRHNLEIKYSFKTYISAVVKYEIYAKIAGLKKRKDQAGVEADNIDLIDDSTQQWLEFDELRNYIETAMNVLPEKCRLVFSLSRFDELSNEEIAQSLNLSKKTVEAHITKALKTLRDNMGNISSYNAFLILFLLKK